MPVPSTLASVKGVVKKRTTSCSACREKKMKCEMPPGTKACARCETRGVECSGPQPTPQAVKKKEQRKQFSNSRTSGVVYQNSLGFGAHHAGTGSASAASAPATVPVVGNIASSYAPTMPSLSPTMDATYINYSNFAPTAPQDALRNNGGDQFLAPYDMDESFCISLSEEEMNYHDYVQFQNLASMYPQQNTVLDTYYQWPEHSIQGEYPLFDNDSEGSSPPY